MKITDMKITEALFEKRYFGERLSIPIKDIPLEFLKPENNIMVHVEHGENGSNGWEEGGTTIIISHYREQTNEEKEEFREHLNKLKAERLEQRRKEYFKLKKEFEP